MDRYRIFCERLLRERLYDAACFLLSDFKNFSKLPKVSSYSARFDKHHPNVGYPLLGKRDDSCPRLQHLARNSRCRAGIHD